MCAEKIQRLLMAIVLTVSMVLFVEGYTQYAIFVQSFVILMIIIWAIKDFCPSLWGFTKIFGTCGKK